jgi:hypothetical protein
MAECLYYYMLAFAVRDVVQFNLITQQHALQYRVFRNKLQVSNSNCSERINGYHSVVRPLTAIEVRSAEASLNVDLLLRIQCAKAPSE